MKSNSRRQGMVIIIAVLTVLTAVWAVNGYEDTWLYLAAGIIAVPASWFFFGTKNGDE